MGKNRTATHDAAQGLDLGGTKIEIVVLGAGGNELFRHRVPTPQGDYGATIEAIVLLITEAERITGEAGSIGIGTPGALSAQGLIKNSNSTCLNGRPLKSDLEARLGRSIRIANDANCFALSEATDGAGAGARIVFGVILGTGVGGGLVVDGKVVTGRNAIAGEWGHNRLAAEMANELPGPSCYCGRSGCIETYLSGPGLARDYREALAMSGVAANPAFTGEKPIDPSAADIARAAEQGDRDCEAALVRYEGRLARALAQVINIVDPDVIVLGGGLSNIARLYRTVPVLWAPHVFSDTIATRLTRNHHGDSSGVRGAVWLGTDQTTGSGDP